MLALVEVTAGVTRMPPEVTVNVPLVENVTGRRGREPQAARRRAAGQGGGGRHGRVVARGERRGVAGGRQRRDRPVGHGGEVGPVHGRVPAEDAVGVGRRRGDRDRTRSTCSAPKSIAVPIDRVTPPRATVTVCPPLAATARAELPLAVPAPPRVRPANVCPDAAAALPITVSVPLAICSAGVAGRRAGGVGRQVDRQRPRQQRDRRRVEVRRAGGRGGERQRAEPLLGEPPGAGEVGTGERRVGRDDVVERGGGGERGRRPGGDQADRVQPQRAAVDNGRPGVGVGPDQPLDAGPVDRDAAGAGQAAVERVVCRQPPA